MKHLNLNTIVDLLEAQENILASRGIQNFMEMLAQELYVDTPGINTQDHRRHLRNGQTTVTDITQVNVESLNDEIYFSVAYQVKYLNEEPELEVLSVYFYCLGTKWDIKNTPLIDIIDSNLYDKLLWQ